MAKKRPDPLPRFIAIPIAAIAQVAWFLWGGLFCWVPLVARVQIWACLKLADALRRGKHRVASASIRRELRLAATFYVDGVIAINWALFPISVSPEREAELTEEEENGAEQDEDPRHRRARAVVHVMWSAVFWILVFSPLSGFRWLLELVGGLIRAVLTLFGLYS